MIPPYMYYQQPVFAQAPPYSNFNNTNFILGSEFAPVQISTTQTTSYSSYAAEVPILTSTQRRKSSGAWKLQDDNRLVAARMQGLSWKQIQDAHFPQKSANACRKRHERIVERKSAEEDTRKFQRLATEYMGMRKKIWSELAARTGEKWTVVETKVLSSLSTPWLTQSLV